jgi:peptide/nickel transport system permease protein
MMQQETLLPPRKKFETLRRVLKNKKCSFGLALILIFVASAILAPLITSYSPESQDLTRSLSPPSSNHILGTDILGRDVLSRILYGARISMFIALASIGLALGISIPLGVASGYYGGLLDQVIMRIIDVLMAFPSILLAIFFISVLGTGLNNLIIAIGIFTIPTFVRLIRASALAIREEEYIMAAKALGERDFNIIIRYVLPNCTPVIVVQSTLRFGLSILTAAGLGFLGIGVQPPLPEWGLMVSEAKDFLLTSPYVIVFPCIAIALLTLGFNFFGDGLNDVLNPRLKDK